MENMTKREAQQIVRATGREVRFNWHGSDLIRSCWDEKAGAWRESVIGNCCDCSERQAERSAWIREAADIADCYEN